MAKAINKLNPRSAASAELKPGLHSDGDGLYLQITPNGARSWVFRYSLAGRIKTLGLGPFPTVSVQDARAKARKARESRLEGKDPLAEKREAAAARDAEAEQQAAEARQQALVDSGAAPDVFKNVAKDFITANKSQWRNPKHRQQWENTLTTYVFPVIGPKRCAEVNTDDVLSILKPLWNDKPETASRVRGRIETILNAAKVRGFRSGENPAAWSGHLALLLPPKAKVRKVKHHAALKYKELPEFIAAVRLQPGLSPLALELSILTAARTGEALNADWSEFDLDNKVWSVPAERMKAGKPHSVPLSARALEILERLKESKRKSERWLFPGQAKDKPLSNMAMLMLLRRMGRGDLTAHGFRSTFRDWCAETTAYPREVVEMALAHTIENKVEAAYRRGDLFDKRRELMNDWAVFCESGISAG
jgi:integrase